MPCAISAPNCEAQRVRSHLGWENSSAGPLGVGVDFALSFLRKLALPNTAAEDLRDALIPSTLSFPAALSVREYEYRH